MEEETFYQYMSFSKGRYIVRNNCLPLNHFTHYNDPYEGAVDIASFDEIALFYKNVAEPEKREKLISVFLTRILDKENGNTVIKDAFIKSTAAYAAKKLIPVNMLAALAVLGSAWLYSAMTNKKVDVNKIKFENYLNEFYSRLISTYTSCFSKSNKELLMWSHYADSHKGVVLGFNSNKEPFKNNPPLKVDYSTERALFPSDNLSNSFNNPDIWEDVKTVLLRKSSKWEYENEFRFFFDETNNEETKEIEGCNDKKIIWYDHYDNPIIKLEEDTINSIYFGMRISQDSIEQIKHILEGQKRLNKISLYKCKQSQNNYMIEFEKI